MICPDCQGEGVEVAAHVLYADGSCGFGVPLRCSRCEGKGAVDDRTPEWVKQGRAMRDARVHSTPYRSQRDEAKRRGMDVVTLSRMEMGKIRPVPEEAP